MQLQLQLLSRQLEQQGDEAAAHVPGLAAALDRLEASAGALEPRLLRLEAQAAVAQQDREAAAVGQWATLVRSARYNAAVRQLRDGLQAQLLDAQAACQQQAAQLRQLQAALDAARADCEALAAQAQDARLLHQQELERCAVQQQREIAAVHQQAEEQARALREQGEAATSAAVAYTEERCRVETAARWAC